MNNGMNQTKKKLKLKKKIRHAWCLVKGETIPENNDDPKFLCIHRSKTEADGARMVDEVVIRCTIVYYV